MTKNNYIIVGNTIDALRHSYVEGISLLYVDNNDTLSEEQNKILFSLSMRGLVPFSDNVRSISIEEDSLELSIKNGRRQTINGYDKIYIYDDKSIVGIDHLRQEVSKDYLIIDEFYINSETFDLVDIDDECDFVYKISFSKEANKKVARCYTKTDEQGIANSNISEANVRMKLLSNLKKEGIRGPKNGFNKILNRQNYLALNAKHRSRVIKKSTKDLYNDTEKIIFFPNRKHELCIENIWQELFPSQMRSPDLDSSGTTA